jgi:sucrose phosphorylase
VRRRVAQPAFHPNASQSVLDVGPRVFAVLREREGVQRLLALTNVTDQPVRVRVPASELGAPVVWRDVLSRARYQVHADALSVALPPYGIAWLSST